MKKDNIKNNIIAGLFFALAISIGGWSYYYENAKVLQDIVVEQDDNNKKLSIEIANLEDIIVKKEDDLNATKMVIDEQKIQIEENERRLTLLKVEIEKLKKESPTSQISRGSSNIQYSLTVNASAYQAMCHEGCTGFTAVSYDVRNTIYYNGYRIIATDPKVIPLYSIVEIEGFSEKFISLDTGGAIKGNKIDILVKSEGDAVKFGRKNLKINVIRKGR